jgi:PPIC-type PPIASE domain
VEESLRVLSHVLVCLLLAAVALGQSTSAPTLKPRSEASPAPKPAATENAAPAPGSPIITIQGLCENPVGSGATPSDCKTIITREDFEKVAPANLPGAQKKRVADQYIQALLLAGKARESGVDHSPEFEKQMYFLRLRALATAGYQDLQKQTSNVSDIEVEDYYKQHLADFKAISFDKLYVPKQKVLETSALKPNDPDLQKKREASETEMKAEADKLRARAAAGEDFTKLQQEAYDFAGLKQTAQNTHMDNQRKGAILPADASIFELKTGDVSRVFNAPAGFMVYKITEIKDLPVTTVHDEIARALQAEKLKAAMDGLQNSVKTTLDESYFATPAPPTLRKPEELPVQNPPPSGKK